MQKKDLFLIFLGKSGAGPKLALDFSKEIVESEKIENFSLLISENNFLKGEFLEMKNDTKLINTPNLNKDLFLMLPRFIFHFYKALKQQKKKNIKNYFFVMTHPYNLIAILLIKIFIRKSNIVYTCHAFDFTIRRFRDAIERIIVKIECLMSNIIVALSNEVGKDINKVFRGKRVEILFHPLFRHIAAAEPKNLSDHPIFLMFGRIIKYKGLEILLPAFEKLSAINNSVRLIIAGEGEIEKKELHLINKINEKYNNILLKNSYIDEKEVDNIWLSVDILVAPYLNSLQSGVIPIAINKAVPSIITPHNALIEQCFIDTDTPVALCAKDITSDDLLSAMEKILDSKVYCYLSSNCIDVQKELTWSVFLGKILDVLK